MLIESVAMHSAGTKEERVDTRTMLHVMERVLDDGGAAVLATIGADGRPHMRWMTPAVVRGRDGFLYAVTAPDFSKAADVTVNPAVEWMIQTKSLSEVVTVRGSMAVVDNAAAKAEVLEAIGGRLGVFWKLNTDESRVVVLETEISEIALFKPVSGERSTGTFGGSHE